MSKLNEKFFPDPEFLRLKNEIQTTPNLFALQELLPEVQDFNSQEELHRRLIISEFFISAGTYVTSYLIELAEKLSKNEYSTYEAIAGFFFLASFFILIGHLGYFVMNRPNKLEILREELKMFNIQITGNYFSATTQMRQVEEIIKTFDQLTSSDKLV